MSDLYHALTSMRRVDYEGVDELLWVTKDEGAFNGPLMDWRDDHGDFIHLVKKFDTVIQAGGNCGMYPRFYENYFSNVWTWEPEPLNFYCLDRNCVGPHYHKFNAALGDKEAMLSMTLADPINVGMHMMNDTPGTVPVKTIDSYDIQGVDLIHLDLEGYEEKALRGAEKTILKYRPIIITEHGVGHAYLRTLGYGVFKTTRMDAIFYPV